MRCLRSRKQCQAQNSLSCSDNLSYIEENILAPGLNIQRFEKPSPVPEKNIDQPLFQVVTSTSFVSRRAVTTAKVCSMLFEGSSNVLSRANLTVALSGVANGNRSTEEVHSSNGASQAPGQMSPYRDRTAASFAIEQGEGLRPFDTYHSWHGELLHSHLHSLLGEGWHGL